MKKLKGSFAAKLTAVVLLCLLALLFALSAVGTAWLSETGAYGMDLKQAEDQALERTAAACLEQAGRAYRANEPPQYLGTNFRYTIVSPEGEELLTTYAGEEARWEGSTQVQPSFHVEHRAAELSPDDWEEWPPEVTPTPRPVPTGEVERRSVIHVFCYDNNEEYEFLSDAELIRWRNANALTVKGYVLRDMTVADEFSRALSRVDLLYGYRAALPVAAGLSLLLGLLLFIFLCAAAGHRAESDEISESFVDRIPFDLFTLLIAGAAGIVFAVAFGAGLPANVIGVSIITALLLVIGLLLLLWCMSFAVRVKRATLWQNCLITRLLGGCLRLLREGAGLTGRALRALPLLGRGALLLAAAWLGWLLLMALFGIDGESFFLWFIEHLLLTGLALYLLLAFRRLRLGAKAIAAGDERCSVDTRYLAGELREHAEDLNHIRDGLSAAVAERMKSERMRTELITNVSHDIKTPLTSIVNYVDLLEKEEPQNERVREYVEVLSRQAARLKKLIDDLIEASKASTGNLRVDRQPCELGVLLEQTAGEYGERLAAAGLELLLERPGEPVRILADGRHMWRIFDNLMGNILHYAQPGTRVYLDLERREGRALVTFRNISRSRLHVSGEELLERFVRGDSARSSEGSGLGLSIARSLAELQGGTLDVQVDGDLFKVTLTFDCA